jgi:hypothetical protein
VRWAPAADAGLPRPYAEDDQGRDGEKRAARPSRRFGHLFGTLSPPSFFVPPDSTHVAVQVTVPLEQSRMPKPYQFSVNVPLALPAGSNTPWIDPLAELENGSSSL